MTLAQLKVFVLVARLGSVRAAASALGVSEPAVSQALAALRQHLDDPLVARGGGGMELTAAGQRVVGIASQMVNLAVEAEEAVRQSRGAPALLRVVATSTLADAVAPALLQAFSLRVGQLEVTLGIASTAEMAALLAERLADVALGPRLSGLGTEGLVSEPLLRYRLAFIAASTHPLARITGPIPVRRLAGESWFVDPAGTDPDTEVGQLIARLGTPDDHVRVFPNHHAALAAAANGAGIVPAVEHLVAGELDSGSLVKLPIAGAPLDLLWYVTSLASDRRSAVVSKLRRFLATPDAMQAMYRADGGVPASRFKPPVYVTIWS